MKNTYFEFKQFRIEQDRCAMKVCTDACLFGAWSANHARRSFSGKFEGLDIGAGTGLLSLMMAQETAATMEAWEIDQEASGQAAENITASPWKDRIRVRRADARTQEPDRKFDFIISNPPFYEGDLKSSTEQSRIAWHSELLTLVDLIMIIDRHLSGDGVASVLLPFHRTSEFLTIAGRCQFFPCSLMYVRQSEKHPPFRTCVLLRRGGSSAIEEETVLIREAGTYSSRFSALLQDFYLHL